MIVAEVRDGWGFQVIGEPTVYLKIKENAGWNAVNCYDSSLWRVRSDSPVELLGPMMFRPHTPDAFDQAHP